MKKEGSVGFQLMCHEEKDGEQCILLFCSCSQKGIEAEMGNKNSEEEFDLEGKITSVVSI